MTKTALPATTGEAQQPSRSPAHTPAGGGQTEQLEAGLRHHSLISNEETRKRYVQLLAHAREEYDETVKHEVQVAVSSDGEATDRLCSKYIDKPSDRK